MKCIDKNIIIEEKMLNDHHMNYAQSLLKNQFPSLKGLISTLLVLRQYSQESSNMIQVIHSHGDHWIVVSTIMCKETTVKDYDSVYSSIDCQTKAVVDNISCGSSVELAKMQKQINGTDCGIFTIAVSTSLAFGEDPSRVMYDQSAMRPHLVHCFADSISIKM